MLDHALGRYLVLATFPVLVAGNAGLGAMLAGSRTKGVALAVLPVTLVALGALIASSRAALVFAAFAIILVDPLNLTGKLPLPTGTDVYASDILVLLALASWAAAWLLNPKERRPSPVRTQLLGWPLLLFGMFLLAAIVKGHERYGEKLIGVPFRFLLYAGIAVAVTDLTARNAYRWLVVFFYTGTVWQALVALYRDATGTTSAALSGVLSTGGERVLAGSTAMFMAGALLLALLNLELDRRPRRAALHVLIAVLATFALVSTLQRTTFAVLALLVPLALLSFRRIGLRIAALLPLCAPLLLIFALLLPKADPTFFPTLAHRITASPSTDTSAQWRVKANAAVWSQVREAPLTGVGFGRPASFVLNEVHVNVGQDPHDQFLFLWAGGGLLLLASFVLLLMVYVLESWRRFRSGTKEERRLIFWAVSMMFVFVVNSLTGIVLTQPHLLLTFWILLVLPMVVRPREPAAAAAPA